jgi:hypothetical protein
MAVRTISQRDYSKGLVAVTQELAQPRGTVQRISNMLFTRRGGLKTCDGGVLIAEAHGVDWTRGNGGFLATAIAQLVTPPPDAGPNAALTVAQSGASFVWSGIDNIKVQDNAFATVFLSGDPGNIYSNTLLITNFDFDVPATSTILGVQVEVRRRKQTGTSSVYGRHQLLGITGGAPKDDLYGVDFWPDIFTGKILGGSGDAWNGTITPAQVNDPAFGVSIKALATGLPGTGATADIEYVTIRVYFLEPTGAIAPEVVLPRRYALREVTQPLDATVLLSYDNPAAPTTPATYADTDIIAELPGSAVRTASFIDIEGAVGDVVTVNGGIIGRLSAKPQLFSYQNHLIAILGNGYPPQQFVKDGSLIPLTNEFTSSVPEWGANTPYIVGTLINAAPENDHFYRCIQAGVSGGAAPTFPTGVGATVADGNSIIWQENGTNSVIAPRGAAHSIVHAGFLWLFNTYPATTDDLLDGPSALVMSELNNPNSYNPINRAYLDKDDGTEGMGLASLAISELGIAPTLTLLAFKNYSTYLIDGVFGDPNFRIVRAKTDLGCIAPRTIQFLPNLGIMRLTHKGFAITNGIKDVIVSDSIRPYLFDEVPDITPIHPDYVAYSHSMQTDSPPMYVASVPLKVPDLQGQQRRLFCFDLISKAWTVTDVPFSILSMTALRPSLSNPILSAELNSFTDGKISAWQAGGTSWVDDPMVLVNWSFQSQDTFGTSPSNRTYFRRVFMRGIATGTVTVEALITVNGTGQPQVAMKRFTMGSGRFEAEIPIMLTGLSASAQISGSGTVEIDSLEWHVVPKPAGMPVSIMQ